MSTSSKSRPLSAANGDLLGEIATRLAAGDTGFFFGSLPNPDPVLRAMGRHISVYRSLIADPAVMGARRRRIAAVLSLARGINLEKSKRTTPQVIQACEAALARLDIPSLICDWMDGAFYGYRVSEVIWEASAAGITPAKVVAKPCEWFGFGPERGELRFHPIGSIYGEAVPERKFIVVGKMRSWDNPYGESDLSACFWPLVFKRAGFKFWATFTEKYGMPWAIGKLPRHATQAEVDALADKLDAMVRDAVAVVPGDGSVELLSPASSVNSKFFERFVMFCRSEISIALLGNNQSVEMQSNLANAQAAHLVEVWLRADDAEMVADGFNQLVRLICEVNYPGAVPPVYDFLGQEAISQVRIGRDEKLTQAGCKFSNQYFKRAYKLGDSDVGPARGIQPR